MVRTSYVIARALYVHPRSARMFGSTQTSLSILLTCKDTARWPILPFQPKYCLGHPENYSLSLITCMFIDQSIQINYYLILKISTDEVTAIHRHFMWSHLPERWQNKVLLHWKQQHYMLKQRHVKSNGWSIWTSSNMGLLKLIRSVPIARYNFKFRRFITIKTQQAVVAWYSGACSVSQSVPAKARAFHSACWKHFECSHSGSLMVVPCCSSLADVQGV